MILILAILRAKGRKLLIAVPEPMMFLTSAAILRAKTLTASPHPMVLISAVLQPKTPIAIPQPMILILAILRAKGRKLLIAVPQAAMALILAMSQPPKTLRSVRQPMVLALVMLQTKIRMIVLPQLVVILTLAILLRARLRLQTKIRMLAAVLQLAVVLTLPHHHLTQARLLRAVLVMILTLVAGPRAKIRPLLMVLTLIAGLRAKTRPPLVVILILVATLRAKIKPLLVVILTLVAGPRAKIRPLLVVILILVAGLRAKIRPPLVVILILVAGLRAKIRPLLVVILTLLAGPRAKIRPPLVVILTLLAGLRVKLARPEGLTLVELPAVRRVVILTSASLRATANHRKKTRQATIYLVVQPRKRLLLVEILTSQAVGHLRATVVHLILAQHPRLRQLTIPSMPVPPAVVVFLLVMTHRRRPHQLQHQLAILLAADFLSAMTRLPQHLLRALHPTRFPAQQLIPSVVIPSVVGDLTLPLHPLRIPSVVEAVSMADREVSVVVHLAGQHQHQVLLAGQHQHQVLLAGQHQQGVLSAGLEAVLRNDARRLVAAVAAVAALRSEVLHLHPHQ